jgi:tetratricopeptide (TPR) repeat protein
MSRLRALWLWCWPLAVFAAPDDEIVAMDRANEALAEGRPQQAAQILGSVQGVTDPDSLSRLGCLQGVAWLDADEPGRALSALRSVPRETACGTRAAFLRADALSRLDRLDEAASLYEEVGAPLLGDDRDAASVSSLQRLAERLLASPDGRERGVDLLARLLGFQISPARRTEIARRAAQAVREHGMHRRSEVCAALLSALEQQESVEDRRLALANCYDPDASRIATGLPATDAQGRMLLAQLRNDDPMTADRIRGLALQDLSGDALVAARWQTAQQRAAHQRLDALPLLTEDGRPDALREAARLLSAAGRWTDALALLDRHLETFPSDRHRSEVAALRAELWLALARTSKEPVDALSWYDRLTELEPGHPSAPLAAFEAGYVERERGQPDLARQRWEEAAARWPQIAPDAFRALARQLLVDRGQPEAAFDLLRQADGEGVSELERMEAEEVWVASPGRLRPGAGKPHVRVGTRNLEEIEVRLHEIDLEAWVRSGARLEALDELDVQAIAPDRTLTVGVPDPDPYVDRAFDAPLPVGPGLWSVTVAAPESEAQALLLVSDLAVVARASGYGLAVATFDSKDRPVGHARVVVVGEGQVLEGETDGQGLYLFRGDLPLNPVIVAEHRGSWAATSLDHAELSGPSVSARISGELDRPVYLPGDSVGLRLLARDDEGEPVVGEWTLWLSGEVETTPITASTDERGLLVTELGVPSLLPHDQNRTSWTVMGVAPGSASPVAVTPLMVARPDPFARTLTGRMEGEDAVLEVRGPQGEPVQGVPVRWGEEVGTTDARGQLHVPGPALSLPWSLQASVVGTPLTAQLSREPLERGRVHLALDTAVRPSEPVSVDLELRDARERPVEGTVELALFRKLATPETPQPRPDPWVEIPDVTLRGFLSWEGFEPEPRPGVLEEVSRQEIAVQAGHATLRLPELPPGDYVVSAVVPNGTAWSASETLTVAEDALDLQGARDIASGERLVLSVGGGSALLTAESGTLLWAAVRADGQRVEVPTDPSWTGPVTLVATSPDGQVDTRTIEADAALHVALEVVPEGDRFQIEARVTDGAGKAVPGAQVSLRAWDERLLRQVGRAPSLRSWWDPGYPSSHGGLGLDLADGGLGEGIAPGLLAEAERMRERERAARAGITGLLSDNALARAMLGENSFGMGAAGMGVGASGYGMGGGGWGARGEGGIGTVGGGQRLPGVSGVRERVLWTVAETGRDGVVRAVLDAPPALYELDVTAVTAEAFGQSTRQVDARQRTWLVLPPVAEGLPGDVAVPRVTLVNGTVKPLAQGSLRLDEGELVPVSVGAGEALTVTLGEGVPASPRGHRVIWQHAAGQSEGAFRFPLAAGSASAEGALTVVARGPHPLGSVAMRPDPGWEAASWRVAVAGRAALAAMGAGREDTLIRRVRDAREHARRAQTPPDALGTASLLLLLAEAREAGLTSVSEAELERIASSGPEPRSQRERLWLARGRAAAGLVVDPDLLAVLDELDSEQRALLGFVELASGRRPRVPEGTGPVEAALRRELGAEVDLAALGSPPEPGDPLLPDWIAAVAPSRRSTPGAPLPVEVGEGTAGEGTAGEGTAGLSWRVDPPAGGTDYGSRLRVGASEDGRVVWPEMNTVEGCDPCKLGVGDGLVVGERPLWVPSGLVADTAGGQLVLRATTPGRFTVAGLSSRFARDLFADTVQVEVTEERPEALSPAAALPLAARALDAKQPVVLPDEVPDALVARAAQLALQNALLGGDEAAIGRAFLTLASVDRDARVPLPQVARAASALQHTGDPATAVRVWRAGLDSAFAAEAATLARMEAETSALVVIQKVREAALRYPDGPRVGEALYLLPARLIELSKDELSPELTSAGITRTDLELTAVAWDREFLGVYREHTLAPVVGLRMSRILLGLRLPAQAAAWSQRVAAAHPEDPLLDALLYLEALALTEASDQAEAQKLLLRLAHRPFLDEAGTPVPSQHREDALLVLGRWEEARGNLDRARSLYAEAATPAALQAASALDYSALDVPALVQLEPGQSTLDVQAIHVDEVDVRAYRVDLRTLFLRDGGLGQATELDVAGVSPEWSGKRHIGAGAYYGAHRLSLPLQGTGAWIVQIVGEGVSDRALVVRTGLELSVLPVAGSDRVAVRRNHQPVVGAEVRALSGQVTAAVTDIRGIATVPQGSSVLVWAGAEWAFTPPAENEPSSTYSSHEVEPLEDLVGEVDRRLLAGQQQDSERWLTVQDASASLELQSL